MDHREGYPQADERRCDRDREIQVPLYVPAEHYNEQRPYPRAHNPVIQTVPARTVSLTTIPQWTDPYPEEVTSNIWRDDRIGSINGSPRTSMYLSQPIESMQYQAEHGEESLRRASHYVQPTQVLPLQVPHPTGTWHAEHFQESSSHRSMPRVQFPLSGGPETPRQIPLQRADIPPYGPLPPTPPQTNIPCPADTPYHPDMVIDPVAFVATGDSESRRPAALSAIGQAEETPLQEYSTTNSSNTLRGLAPTVNTGYLPLSDQMILSVFPRFSRGDEDEAFVEEKDVGEAGLLKRPSNSMLAAKVFARCLFEGSHALVVAFGEKGSGKKEACKEVIEELAFLSISRLRAGHRRPESSFVAGETVTSFSDQSVTQFSTLASTAPISTAAIEYRYALILKAHGLFEVLGCSPLPHSPNSASFGLWTDLQFSRDGILKGADFSLCAARFDPHVHISRLLLEGCSDDRVDRWKLGLLRSRIQFDRDLPLYYANGLEEFREVLHEFGAGRGRTSSDIQRLVVAILHLTLTGIRTREIPGPDLVEPANLAYFAWIAEDLLGLDHWYTLWSCISTNSIWRKDAYVTEYVDATRARLNRDQLVQSMYRALMRWVSDLVNKKLSFGESSVPLRIGILSFPGLESDDIDSVEAFVRNWATESTWSHVVGTSSRAAQLLDGIAEDLENIRGYRDSQYLFRQKLEKYSNDPAFTSSAGSKFGIDHALCTANPVLFTTELLALRSGMAFLSPIILECFKQSQNTILKDGSKILSDDVLDLLADRVDDQERPIMGLRTKGHEKRRLGQFKEFQSAPHTYSSSLQVNLAMARNISSLLTERTTWTIICIKPSELSDRLGVNSSYVSRQLRAYEVEELLATPRPSFPHVFSFLDFTQKFFTEDLEPGANLRRQLEKFRESQFVAGERQDMRIRANDVALTDQGYYKLIVAANLRGARGSKLLQDSLNFVGTSPSESDDGEKEVVQVDEDVFQEVYRTKVRRFWMMLVNVVTCLISENNLKKYKIHPAYVRVAWREKFTLCFLFALTTFFVLFAVPVIASIICPPEAELMSLVDLATSGTILNTSKWFAINGVVYDIGDWVHPGLINPEENFYPRLGEDISALFPTWTQNPLEFPRECGRKVEISALLSEREGRSRPLNGTSRLALRPATSQAGSLVRETCSTEEDAVRFCHDTWEIRQLQQEADSDLSQILRVADLGWTLDEINERDGGANADAAWLAIDGVVYDVTELLNAEPEERPPSISESVVEVLSRNLGREVETDEADLLEPVIVCLETIAFAGRIDRRVPFFCFVARYNLIIFTSIMLSIVLFKFVTSINLGSRRLPETFDRYVVIQVPCYSESEKELKVGLDSLSATDYPDDRKLLFIVCDGMVQGGGADCPTPEVVLDCLGVPPEKFRDDPEPALEYQAIGDGKKQYNRGRVYCGYYKYQGRSIPYITVVKCGGPSEVVKPGNRGKRDSQMILMRFMNRLIQGKPMTAMELDIYDKIWTTFGIDPMKYEYCVMVDADTSVHVDSITSLVAVCVSDTRIMGITGEAEIMNPAETWVTRIQVFEYFINFYLAKEFESLFGTVTCLPGCFCMYRFRNNDERNPIPILAHDDIIDAYSECVVDTLHRKNLFSLGEDRYLTTLMLSRFPHMKTKFIGDAKCETEVPTKMSVLLSQRRRWINSTIHNLFELMTVGNLCSCLLIFNMRIIVLLDLIGTIIMPGAMLYGIFILISAVAGNARDFISLFMLIATFLVQAIVVTLRKRWVQVKYFLYHVMAVPIFQFAIPLYAFWHFDDFSWGQTRVVKGEGAGKPKSPVGEEAEEDVDATDIQTMTLEEYFMQKHRLREELTGYTLGDSDASGVQKSAIMDDSSFSESVRRHGDDDSSLDYQATTAHTGNQPSMPVIDESLTWGGEISSGARRRSRAGTNHDYSVASHSISYSDGPRRTGYPRWQSP